jgi:hypothetical protein
MNAFSARRTEPPRFDSAQKKLDRAHQHRQTLEGVISQALGPQGARVNCGRTSTLAPKCTSSEWRRYRTTPRPS